jgi:hypothetical protein
VEACGTHALQRRIRETERAAEKREREERYARRTRPRTEEREDIRNASEPPAVGSHTTKPIHHRSQSEGGGNNRTYQKEEKPIEDNLAQSEDEDDLIIGTPFGTYVLRTKGTGVNTGTHTPEGGAQGKGKNPQEDATEDLLNQRDWEGLKKKIEAQFSFEDSSFSGGSTQNNTDQGVKRPINQEEFDELRRRFEERLKKNPLRLKIRSKPFKCLPSQNLKPTHIHFKAYTRTQILVQTFIMLTLSESTAYPHSFQSILLAQNLVQTFIVLTLSESIAYPYSFQSTHLDSKSGPNLHRAYPLGI